ncbi:hypothetical protein JTE90_013971 [Oedothorax gibbosus]|uniref:Uncharacterized protein n=1 Tax=Oedothorax gibbosus TaxID=931172 RepID=A0AAV6UFL6_9ARAC|nr:hypothetical protein JTE90_013971 [Oedothorax gibbosus]
MALLKSCFRCFVPCTNRRKNASRFQNEPVVKWKKDDIISFETLTQPHARSYDHDRPSEIQDEVHEENSDRLNFCTSLESLEPMSPNVVPKKKLLRVYSTPMDFDDYDRPAEMQNDLNESNGDLLNVNSSLESLEPQSPNAVTKKHVFPRMAHLSSSQIFFTPNFYQSFRQNWHDFLAKHSNVANSEVFEDQTSRYSRPKRSYQIGSEDEASRQLKLEMLHRRNPALFSEAMKSISNKK